MQPSKPVESTVDEPNSEESDESVNLEIDMKSIMAALEQTGAAPEVSLPQGHTFTVLDAPCHLIPQFNLVPWLLLLLHPVDTCSCTP